MDRVSTFLSDDPGIIRGSNRDRIRLRVALTFRARVGLYRDYDNRPNRHMCERRARVGLYILDRNVRVIVKVSDGHKIVHIL